MTLKHDIWKHELNQFSITFNLSSYPQVSITELYVATINEAAALKNCEKLQIYRAWAIMDFL